MVARCGKESTLDRQAMKFTAPSALQHMSLRDVRVTIINLLCLCRCFPHFAISLFRISFASSKSCIESSSLLLHCFECLIKKSHFQSKTFMYHIFLSSPKPLGRLMLMGKYLVIVLVLMRMQLLGMAVGMEFLIVCFCWNDCWMITTPLKFTQRF